MSRLSTVVAGAILLLALGVVSPSPARAAENGSAGWIGVALRVPFAERYAFNMLTEPRLFEKPNQPRILLLRPWFEVALQHGLAVGLGYDGLLFFNPRVRQEHRIWQQLSHGHRWKPLRSLLRVRLEQRFFSDAARVSVRSRFLAGLEVPIVGQLSFLVSEELFVSFNDIPRLDSRGVSENRVYGGFGWRLNDWFKTTLGYQMQWLKQLRLNNHTVMAHFILTIPEKR